MATCVRTFGTFTDDNAIGTISWTNPSLAGDSDDIRTSCALTAGATGHYINLTNSSHLSGTALASGDTITQIDFIFEKAQQAGGAGTVKDDHVYPIEAGSRVTTTNYADTGTAWAGSDTDKTYSQTSNIPAASVVLASDWGVSLNCKETSTFAVKTALIDYVRASITFTPAPAVIYVPPLVHSQAISRAANY